jgi:hypothetical protein
MRRSTLQAAFDGSAACLAGEPQEHSTGHSGRVATIASMRRGALPHRERSPASRGKQGAAPAFARARVPECRSGTRLPRTSTEGAGPDCRSIAEAAARGPSQRSSLTAGLDEDRWSRSRVELGAPIRPARERDQRRGWLPLTEGKQVRPPFLSARRRARVRRAEMGRHARNAGALRAPAVWAAVVARPEHWAARPVAAPQRRQQPPRCPPAPSPHRRRSLRS